MKRHLHKTQDQEHFFMSKEETSVASYVCRDDDAGQVCAATCVSLAACLACQCTLVDHTNDDGATATAQLPGGKVVAFIFCLMPIVFLVVATIKKNPLKATYSLPAAAIMQLYIRTMYLGNDPLLSCGAVLLGWLDALTLLSVMAGAITLLECMEISYCLPYMVREMKVLTSGHVIAEIMLIFNFNYLVREKVDVKSDILTDKLQHWCVIECVCVLSRCCYIVAVCLLFCTSSGGRRFGLWHDLGRSHARFVRLRPVGQRGGTTRVQYGSRNFWWHRHPHLVWPWQL
jgi:hypothetical protein